MAVLCKMSSIGLNKNTVYLCCILLSIISGKLNLISCFRLGPKLDQLLIYHREIDFTFKQLRIIFGYHSIVIVIILQFFLIIESILSMVVMSYYKLIVAESDKYFSFLIILLFLLNFYNFVVIKLFFHGNMILIIIKFLKINSYLKHMMKRSKKNGKKPSPLLKFNPNQKRLFSARNDNVAFPLLIDVHFKLCEIVNTMISEFSFAFFYNKHVFISMTTYLTYCYMHGVEYFTEIFWSCVYASNVLFITLVCTFLKKTVSIELDY